MLVTFACHRACAQCPYAQRSVIAARALGVPFKLHPIELGKDNKTEWYKRINPVGKVRMAERVASRCTVSVA